MNSSTKVPPDLNTGSSWPWETLRMEPAIDWTSSKEQLFGSFNNHPPSRQPCLMIYEGLSDEPLFVVHG